MSVDLVLVLAIAGKWTLYLTVFGAAGLVFNRLIFLSETQAFDGLLRRRAAGLAVAGLIATCAVFGLRGAALTGDLGGVSDLRILTALWQTPVGTALVWRLWGLSLLAVACLIGGRALWLAAGGAGLALWSFAVLGHVGAAEGAELRGVLMAHLVAVAFWIGVLRPLRLLTERPDNLPQAAALGHRFGQIASLVVPGLIVAGGIMLWALLGAFTALINTAYGLWMLAKLVGVASLLGLAALNKLRFVPELRNGQGGAELLASLRAERGVFAVIFLVTAVLTTAVSPG